MKRTLTHLAAGLLPACLILAAPRQAIAQEYTFLTWAGLPGNPGTNDGAGCAARFNEPRGLAVDRAGNVYVADSDNYTIRKVTPEGAVTTLAGLVGNPGSADGAGSAARFGHPQGLAVDSTGNLYVADDGNNTIRKVTPDGVVTTLAGLAGSWGSADGPGNAARFLDPQGVAVDTNGNVYVADSGNEAIRQVTPGGVVTTLAGLAGSFGTNDGTGSAARFCFPSGVAVDRSANVYVADSSNFTIRRVTPAGEVTTLAGLAGNCGSTDGTGSAARFYQPYAVAVDTVGNVYVGDSMNFTIRKVAPDGAVTTLGGVAGTAGTNDGTGNVARFAASWAVAVDTAGTVYVGDTGNSSLRIGRVACADVPTIDLAAGPVGQTRQLDTSPQTAVAWRWSLTQHPVASGALLCAADIRNPTFTPDVAGLYVLQLGATNATGAICIRTLDFTATPGPPSIVSEAPTQTAEIGSQAGLEVEVTNAPPGTTYQWYLNGTALTNATNACLGMGNVQAGQAGAYTVVVTDAYGSVTSSLAGLNVIAPVPRRTVPMLDLSGDAGAFLHLDYADTLARRTTWQELNPVSLTNPPQLYLDLSAAVAPSRFYRLWQTNVPTVLPAASVAMAEELTLTGAIGSSVEIDYINQIGPTNAWVALSTITLTNTTQPFFDLTMWQQPNRYYRLVPTP